MTPDTIAFAVRSVVRLGSAARGAYEQYVRDAGMKISDLPLPIISGDEALFGFFDVGERRKRIEEGGDLHDLWIEDLDHAMVPRDDVARDRLVSEQLKILQQLPGDFHNSWISQRFQHEAMTGVLVKQWKDGTGPPTPATRLILAFADVALDYVGSNPGILGVGGNGEKLITALSANFRKMLPDVDKKASWEGHEATYFFVERALSITLHAGLKTVSENPDFLVKEEHYRDLLQNVVEPFVLGFDNNPDNRPQWIDIRDTLLGPVAEAALTTLRTHQEAFFGGKFSSSTAVGAVTDAVLGAAAEGPVSELFAPEGVVRLYRAALDLAIKNPRLFVGATGPKSDLARALLTHIGAAVQNAPPQFDTSLVTDVAIAALDALKDNVPGLLRIKDDARHAVAGDLITQVLSGLQAGLDTGNSQTVFDLMFTPTEAAELLSILMKQAVRTPGIITGDHVSQEVQVLVAIVARAATVPGADLLAPEDWMAIARTIAQEVARNPGRIVALEKQPEQQLASEIIDVLLSAAALALPDGKRGSSLLFGQTLREAVILAVQVAVDNSGKAANNLAALKTFTELLNSTAAKSPEKMGARQWLGLFQAHIAGILFSGLPANMTSAALLSELESRHA